MSAAVGRRLLHGVGDAAEVEPVARPLGVRREDVGGEHLEARVPRADGVGHVLEDLRIQGPAERDVEGVVHVRVALPAGGPALQRLRNGRARAHVAEVDVGGGAAERHAPRVVLGAQGDRRLLGMAHDGVRQMRVGIDAPRHHDQPRGVEHPRRVRRQGAGVRHRRDALALDADVPRPDALRRDHLPASHDQIKHVGGAYHTGGRSGRLAQRGQPSRALGMEAIGAPMWSRWFGVGGDGTMSEGRRPIGCGVPADPIATKETPCATDRRRRRPRAALPDRGALGAPAQDHDVVRHVDVRRPQVRPGLQALRVRQPRGAQGRRRQAGRHRHLRQPEPLHPQGRPGDRDRIWSSTP